MSTSGRLTLYARFERRDVVRVPLGEGGTSSENVLKTTSDCKGGLRRPRTQRMDSSCSARLAPRTSSVRIPIAAIESLSLTFTQGLSLYITVHTSTNSDSSVLGINVVQLTVAARWITGLFDMRLRCVSPSSFTTLRCPFAVRSFTISVRVQVNIFQRT
ncbi:hypothetical protein DFH94DRAFT_244737 [Russula ochroleuca]|jgi:hypothetical protein|uniref:Uncharacterized protein n=1 Tax=Russula ochroleuca TaxID=152965 RepID=A0A9P5TCM6_9AGAM|nr:hypothetical protein DFH94DRAFT_244737 [Russula ochroleuca]